MGKYDNFFEDMQPAKTGGFDGFFDDMPRAAKKPSVAESDTYLDAASSFGTGLAKGVVGAAGVPGDIANFLAIPGDWAREKGYLPPIPKDSIFAKKLPGSQDAIEAAKPYIPALSEKPQTTAGEYAQTVGEFVPMAGRRVLSMGVAPAVASEAAGQATKGTAAEPYARTGAALVTGGVSLIGARPGVAGRAVADAAAGMTPAQLGEMESLLRDAQAMGVNLTRAEAAQAVTNGATRLADLQRVVEGNGGLRNFMAQRPQQVEAAGRAAINQIAPVPQTPSMIGPQVQEAAQGTIKDVQDAINRRTQPLYQAAETQSMGPQATQALAADPLYARELQSIRNDPALNRTVAQLPDDSPVVADLVQRRLRERAQNAAVPGQADSSNLASANYGDAQRGAYQASAAASPELAQARAAQEAMRSQYLEPLMSGPIGKLQNTPEVKGAIEALFPRNPVPNSAPEVLTAVQAVSARNPLAARQLVRAHVESVFNNATRDLQAGENQFGGASFRAQLVGNSQQAENLAAAVRGLPGGDAILPGFDRMLQVMEATGQRQRIGSQTAFNQEIQAQLKGAGVAKEAASLAAGGGLKLPSRIKERFEQWNLGRNTDEIARLLTDPNAATAFRKLVEAKQGSQAFTGALARLVSLASNPSNRQRD